MTGIGDAALALAMVAATVLSFGGVRYSLRPGERQRGLLMIGAALVIFANVLVWTL